MAFLQLALPGILRLAGWTGPPFGLRKARLTEPVRGREMDWTQFRRGRLSRGRDGELQVTPFVPASRLESMALAECLIEVPEGVDGWGADQWVSVQLLTHSAWSLQRSS
jgi:molybdopterin molybdotransferase